MIIKYQLSTASHGYIRVQAIAQLGQDCWTNLPRMWSRTNSDFCVSPVNYSSPGLGAFKETLSVSPQHEEFDRIVGELENIVVGKLAHATRCLWHLPLRPFRLHMWSMFTHAAANITYMTRMNVRNLTGISCLWSDGSWLSYLVTFNYLFIIIKFLLVCQCAAML